MITQKDIKVATASVAEGNVPKIELKDDGPRGGGRLTLAIRPKGEGVTSEWYAVWHHDGQRKSTKLGSFPSMSLKEARDLFRAYYQAEILAGRNPVGPRRWARGETVTVEEMLASYVDNLKKKGAKSADRVSAMLLGPKGVAQSIGPKRRPADITADDLVPYFKEINDRGSIVLANDVRAFTRAAFQYAITSRHAFHRVGGGTDWGLKTNPVDAIPSNPDARKARDRVLSAMEIKSLWDWCVDKERRYLRYRLCATLRLIIATGQRPTEIYRVDKAGYDKIEQALHWKTTKNNRPHTIPLPPIAVEIMEQLSPNEHGLYFWRKFHPAEPLGFDALRQITETYLEETGAEHFQLRDLRRTWKTLTGKLGVSKEIRDRLQNHALKDVSGKHYDRYDYWEEKVDAMQRWDHGLRAILAANRELSIKELRSNVPALMAPAPGIVDADFEVIEEVGDQRLVGTCDELSAVSPTIAPKPRSSGADAYFQPQLI